MDFFRHVLPIDGEYQPRPKAKTAGQVAQRLSNEVLGGILRRPTKAPVSVAPKVVSVRSVSPASGCK